MGRSIRTAFAVLLAAAGHVALCQRPSNASICDYYAEKRYGTNNSTTQFQLMESIVALAFGGGGSMHNASKQSTGILNPGTFEGQSVDLSSWFDGSKATTNLNNQPVGINWLDNGGAKPLMAFLNGSASSVVLDSTTNEYRLFLHFYSAFGFVFGCTDVKQFPQVNTTSSGSGGSSGGFISLAYVHKFMDLNQTDLGHFIDQLTTASVYYGFSQADADTLSTNMNAQYNVRCAPPLNGQLYSLCQATECPLAEPSPDCADYVDIGPSGVGNATSAAGATQTGGGGGASTVTQTVDATATSVSASASATAASSSAGPPLSAGGIAGVAIGGAAALFLAGILLFLVRRRRRARNTPPPSSHQGGGHPHMSTSTGMFPPSSPFTASHASYAGSPHTSYNPYGPHDGGLQGAALGYGGGGQSPKPQHYQHHQQQHDHQQPLSPAELGGLGAGGGGYGYAPRPGDGAVGPIAEMDSTSIAEGNGVTGGSGVMYRGSGMAPSVRVSAASPIGSGSPAPSPSPRRSPIGYGEQHGPP